MTVSAINCTFRKKYKVLVFEMLYYEVYQNINDNFIVIYCDFLHRKADRAYRQWC